MNSQNNFRRQNKMDFRQSRDFDNYITGHYGEDQFRGQEEEEYSVHREYCDNRSLEGVLDYDPATDGPEVEVIRAILIHFPELSPCFLGGLCK
jgi:hypothetical protein